MEAKSLDSGGGVLVILRGWALSLSQILIRCKLSTKKYTLGEWVLIPS